MSYNIDSINIVHSVNFGITGENVVKLQEWLDDNQDRLPECYPDNETWMKPDNDFNPVNGFFQFSDSGSGYAIDNGTFDKMLSFFFTGSADFICCWEGGDSYTGYRYENGELTEHKVVMSLGDET